MVAVDLLINIVVWLYVIYAVFMSFNIKIILRGSSRFMVPTILMFVGMVNFYGHQDMSATITLISMIIASFGAFFIQSGLRENEVIILGRKYSFDKIKNLQLGASDSEGNFKLSFDYKNRTLFLFAHDSHRAAIKDFINKYYYKGAK